MNQMNQNINEVIMDFAFFSAFDMVKSRRLVNQSELLENAIVSASYGFLVKEPSKQLRQFIPQVGQDNSTDMVIKFLSESATSFVYKWAKGMPRDMGTIFLKQLLSQGSQEVFNQFRTI
jgi:hypothetical protein